MRTQWVTVVVPALAVVVVALFVALVPQRTGQQTLPEGGDIASSHVLSNALGMEFVFISGGTFIMGGDASAEEQPPRAVDVRPFYLGKFEVTQAQWEQVMGYNPSLYPNPRRPVDQVTWLDVQSFIERLNAMEGGGRYRLPSEAEWEYAARAGGTARWFFGDDGGSLPRYAWYGQSGDVGTRLVGRGAPNPWGLYDIYGNVWEWVQDCWHGDYRGAPSDARVWMDGGDCGRRMVRGGGWNSSARAARSAARGSYAPNLDDASTGFRLALSR